MFIEAKYLPYMTAGIYEESVKPQLLPDDGLEIFIPVPDKKDTYARFNIERVAYFPGLAEERADGHHGVLGLVLGESLGHFEDSGQIENALDADTIE